MFKVAVADIVSLACFVRVSVWFVKNCGNMGAGRLKVKDLGC